jgi:hypothetical protein
MVFVQEGSREIRSLRGAVVVVVARFVSVRVVTSCADIGYVRNRYRIRLDANQDGRMGLP